MIYFFYESIFQVHLDWVTNLSYVVRLVNAWAIDYSQWYKHSHFLVMAMIRRWLNSDATGLAELLRPNDGI